MLTWIDGQPASALPLSDRGLAYGDGVFETIAVRRGSMPLLTRHLERLVWSAERLALPLQVTRLETELRAFAQQLGQGVAKLIVTRGDGLRGYAPPPEARCRHLLSGAPLPSYPTQHAQMGIRVFPCQTRLAIQPRLAGMKHLNRLEQVLARAEWQDSEHAEGLMCDMHGRVVEGVFSNLFLFKAGVLLTPALTRCGVAGTLRAEIIARVQALDGSVVVRDIEYAELLAADEVFFCNSLYGIWPVVALEHQRWAVGPCTRDLQQQIADVLEL